MVLHNRVALFTESFFSEASSEKESRGCVNGSFFHQALRVSHLRVCETQVNK